MHQDISRRDMLKSASCGFGFMALSALATEKAAAEARSLPGGATNPLLTRAPHFAPKAKRVIFLFMQGGPTHVDTFDYKPALQKNGGKTVSYEYNGKTRKEKLLASPYKFPRQGQSGLPISELFPNLSKHADDLCLINGMHTDNAAHPQATILMHTGSALFVRPSVGSWVLYGLGTENQDLPGFITINPPARLGGAQNYGSSFLPAAFQGTRITDTTSTLPNIKNDHLSADQQRRQLNLVQQMNRDLLKRSQVHSELEGVIESFELAFRMQNAVPEVMSIKSESKKTLERYGIGRGVTDRFGKQCLMARRFAEAGVRYIEVGHGGWDQHKGLTTKLRQNATATDQPIAGLIADLKERGMFEETLLVWGGEFGRSPSGQNKDGRRHNNRGFTVWMAGGGIKGGIRYGETDEFGFAAENNKVHLHDLHATMLHMLGLDHEKLTYNYAGRPFRLTNVYGNVVKDIIA
jgi:hypothetical protein